jgi:hypothetical protein
LSKSAKYIIGIPNHPQREEIAVAIVFPSHLSHNLFKHAFKPDNIFSAGYCMSNINTVTVWGYSDSLDLESCGEDHLLVGIALGHPCYNQLK